MTSWQAKFSPYALRVEPSAIFGLAAMPRAPDTINLGPGEPDTALFPADQLAERMARTLREPASAGRALQYTVNAGDPVLRERIRDYMRGRGVACETENILVTSGAQQALDLLTELLVGPGGRVAVQAPTYTGALGIFKAHGAEVTTIEALRGMATPRAAMVYANTNFHNPTGVTLTPDERAGLIQLAHTADAVLVEDDCYETLSYDEPPLPSMLAMELKQRSIEEARTVFVSTFSKSIAPGLRVGWIVAPRVLVERLTLMKQSEDFQAGTLVQVCIADTLDFIMNEHVPRLRAAYRVRRDTMLQALGRHFPAGAEWTRPGGGFFVWLTLAPGVDTLALLPHAAQAGVTYVPGVAFSHEGRYTNALRLSYSSVSLERLAEGVRRLAQVVEAHGAR